MASLRLSATENTYISESEPQRNFHPAITGYCGVDNENCSCRYLIAFRLSELLTAAKIDRAVMKLYTGCDSDPCNYGWFTPSIITSEWKENSVTWNAMPLVNTDISGETARVGGPGWYHWDITAIAQMWLLPGTANYGLALIPCESKAQVIKGFYTSHCLYYCKPLLEIEYSCSNSCTLLARSTANEFEYCRTTGELGYSQWRNTSSYSTYTFFVQNSGDNPIEAFVQISPDRQAITDEPYIFNIKGQCTEAIVPAKYGFYSRIAFRSNSPGKLSALKVWFQAQV